MNRFGTVMMVGVAIFAIVGQIMEYKKFKHICATHLPDRPINFEYSFQDTDIAGTFYPDEFSIKIAIGGKITNREQTLWHELGHASTFYIYDKNENDIHRLIDVFMSHSLFYQNCAEFNWHFSYVSEYACSNVLEDIAETYAHIMVKNSNSFLNSKTKTKAFALCQLFKKYNISCE